MVIGAETMISYVKLKNKPRVFRALTGLSLRGFETLLPAFEAAWENYMWEHNIQGKNRQRQYGGGRIPQLVNLEDKLVFILVYFRLYPTQEVQGFLFGISQGQANEWIHKLTKVLNTSLGYQKQLPERKAHNMEQLLGACLSLEFFIDGTERPIWRPKDKEKQKTHYSGKKKRHTVKNNIISDRRGKVLYLSNTYEGKKHDKKIADEEEYRFPQGSHLWKDTGFQGYEPEGVTTHQPKKKPRNAELTSEEKETNRAISKERVVVEHHIGGVKRSKIVHDIFRNRKAGYDDLVMETASGLHNLRIDERQLAA